MQMIRDFPKWWAFLIYDGFKSHVNVTEGLYFFAEERIGVGKEEAGTSAFNQAYDKFQAKKDKAQTRQILDLALRKVHVRITQWQLIMVISTAIQNISAQVWTDSFVAVNLHPHHITGRLTQVRSEELTRVCIDFDRNFWMAVEMIMMSCHWFIRP